MNLALPQGKKYLREDGRWFVKWDREVGLTTQTKIFITNLAAIFTRLSRDQAKPQPEPEVGLLLSPQQESGSPVGALFPRAGPLLIGADWPSPAHALWKYVGRRPNTGTWVIF